MRRTTKRILILVTSLLTGLSAIDTACADRPNVLFILADDLGYGDLRCYGNPYLDTPVIDSLAESGVRLTNHYSPSPLCAPARAGYLTGRYNHRTGAVDVSSNRGIDRIALSEVTFGDYFREAGYTTALIGKWHNGLYCYDYLPHKRGFDLFYGFANGGQDYWKWNLQRNDVIEPHDGRYMTDVFNQEAIEFIRTSHKQQKPFALFLAHHAPHPPLQAPEALIDKYRERLAGKYSDDVAIIYAMIEQMDTGLGWVLDELRRLGIMENTIIVFTSDNGAHLGDTYRRFDAGLRGNKGIVLEQGIRVPAIVAWQGKIPGGRVVDKPVHGCDWLPTLYSLTGAPAPDHAKAMDGVNIFRLLTGKEDPESSLRILPFQKNRYTPVAHSDAAIRQGQWKLYWPGEKTTTTKDIGRDNPSYERGMVSPPWEMPIDPDLPDYSGVMTAAPELYDLTNDPGEQHDLAAAHPELVQKLVRAYDRWFAEVSAEWRNANQEIRLYDRRYWESRDIPDPAVLFRDFWQWHRVPGTDPARDNPLEVFTGYWNYKDKRDE
jgi:arylsulfatase A-like enzyme